MRCPLLEHEGRVCRPTVELEGAEQPLADEREVVEQLHAPVPVQLLLVIGAGDVRVAAVHEQLLELSKVLEDGVELLNQPTNQL